MKSLNLVLKGNGVVLAVDADNVFVDSVFVNSEFVNSVDCSIGCCFSDSCIVVDYTIVRQVQPTFECSWIVTLIV